MSLIYVCDGSFDSVLCAVHYAYYNRQEPDRIVCKENLQIDMFSEYVTIKTDKTKADAVFNSVKSKISKRAEIIIYNVYLSDREDKEDIIYHFLKRAYKTGAAVVNYLVDPWVLSAINVSKSVSREVNRLCGFVRFEKSDNQVLFAKINPTYNILTPLCRYFADRLKNYAWIIFDENRKLAAVYDTKTWQIFKTDLKNEQNIARGDIYQKLWTTFYDTVAIDERRNEKLRRQNMAKKYHANILEMHGEQQRRLSKN